jgi:OOP family OmpA-OmpF porin
MTNLKLIISIFSLAALTGCVGFGAGYDVENLREAEATGSVFTQALTKEYQEFDAFEADQMMDWPDAQYFAEKGLRAASGEAVDPENPENWDTPAEHMDELSAARAALVSALDGGGRGDHPNLAAKAQARYDCWVEQQEENFQPTHIAACREDFHAAMDALEVAMAPPPPEPAPEPMAQPKPYVVYFDFDSTSLSSGARATISAAGNEAERVGAKEFSETGHADRAGSEEYNMSLSLARAAAVRDGLAALG